MGDSTQFQQGWSPADWTLLLSGMALFVTIAMVVFVYAVNKICSTGDGVSPSHLDDHAAHGARTIASDPGAAPRGWLVSPAHEGRA